MFSLFKKIKIKAKAKTEDNNTKYEGQPLHINSLSNKREIAKSYSRIKSCVLYLKKENILEERRLVVQTELNQRKQLMNLHNLPVSENIEQLDAWIKEYS